MPDSLTDQELYAAEGRNGYTDAMNDFKRLWQSGATFVDIMLQLREVYEESLISTVLEDARSQGFI